MAAAATTGSPATPHDAAVAAAAAATAAVAAVTGEAVETFAAAAAAAKAAFVAVAAMPAVLADGAVPVVLVVGHIAVRVPPPPATAGGGGRVDALAYAAAAVWALAGLVDAVMDVAGQHRAADAGAKATYVGRVAAVAAAGAAGGGGRRAAARALVASLFPPSRRRRMRATRGGRLRWAATCAPWRGGVGSPRRRRPAWGQRPWRCVRCRAAASAARL